MLTTVAKIKSRLAITGSGDDTVLGEILAGVEAPFNAYCRRGFCRPAAAETVYFGGGGSVIYLPRWPAVVITTIKEGLDGVYGTALTVTTDYLIDDARGRLIRVGEWLEGELAVQVVYAGGYTDPLTTPLPSGQQYPPAELQEAAIQQASFHYQRRRELGMSGRSLGDGNVSFGARDELLPGVRDMLGPFRRILL